MGESWVKSIKPGCVYVSENWGGDDSKFIVTAVGLTHVLFADYPLLKFNNNYLEYCLTRREFTDRFNVEKPA